jgi:hypothetical protein
MFFKVLLPLLSKNSTSFASLKMPLRAMNKIIVDGNEHKFDFRNQTQLVQTLNN